MRLYIPSLGDKLKLAARWQFALYSEHRNESLWKKLGLPDVPNIHHWNRSPLTPAECGQFNLMPVRVGYTNGYVTSVILPANSILTVDRIYIKKGGEEYNSVTFNLNAVSAGLQKGKCRFWAKLNDVNTMEFEIENS